MSPRSILSRALLTVLAVGLGTTLTAGAAAAAPARHCLHSSSSSALTTSGPVTPSFPRPGTPPTCPTLTR